MNEIPAMAPVAAQWIRLQVATGKVLKLALPEHAVHPGQEPCGDAAAARSGLHFSSVVAPGAESGAESGAVGTPRMGLATRLAPEHRETLAGLVPAEQVTVPERGRHTRFERPVLRTRLRTHQGQPLRSSPPALGQDTQRLLHDLGYGAEELDALQAAGVIGAT